MAAAAPPQTWLTADEAAEHATRARQLLSAGAAIVTERTIRSWVNRGHLQPRGRGDDGLQRFTLADVARAERTTRGRALRLVGIGTH